MSGPAQIEPGTNYTVQSGDTLSGIAQNAYGNGDDWPIIYDANKAVIGPNPDLLLVGQVLAIPTLAPTPGTIYVVQPGDTLTSIAQRAYSDGNKWQSIYDVNKPVIGNDPNLIQPGQALFIPLASSDNLPLRNSQLIQGDILAGFNKDHRVYLFYRFHDQASGRAWLKELIPFLAKTKDVADFNDAFRKDPLHHKATWINVSFTFKGLTTLLNAHLKAASNIPQVFAHFASGPTGNDSISNNGDDGDPREWKFGSDTDKAGHDTTIHAMLNIQSDDPKDLQAKFQAMQALANKHGLSQIFEQKGETLPAPLTGHEHFGFKDGISQPGVAGFDQSDGIPGPNAPLGHVLRHRGSEIIQPGEFILGETSVDSLKWMKDGSFQVVRRLNQNVFQFREEIKSALPADGSMNEDTLGAKLVGRWKSGTPVDRSPEQDDHPQDGGDADGTINDFTFVDSAGLRDNTGLHCPTFAHIRKVYPRDDADFGDRIRRIIRRGIPFGSPLDPASTQDDKADRGLFFVAYMASIENQFEFLMVAWINNPGFPFSPDEAQGPDVVMGQPKPLSACTIRKDGSSIQHTFDHMVHTTGTLYAFVPSVDALKQLANGQI